MLRRCLLLLGALLLLAPAAVRAEDWTNWGLPGTLGARSRTEK